MTIKQVGNEEKLRDKNIDQTQTWALFKILHFRTVMEKAKNGIKIDLICVMVQSSSRDKKTRFKNFKIIWPDRESYFETHLDRLEVD